jgi:hypothetical protein
MSHGQCGGSLSLIAVKLLLHPIATVFLSCLFRSLFSFNSRLYTASRPSHANHKTRQQTDSFVWSNILLIATVANADRFKSSLISRSLGATADIILRGSTSCRRLFLFLWIVAEIASQNIIEAWKRKFQVLPAYIIANSGGRAESGRSVQAQHRTCNTLCSLANKMNVKRPAMLHEVPRGFPSHFERE